MPKYSIYLKHLCWLNDNMSTVDERDYRLFVTPSFVIEDTPVDLTSIKDWHEQLDPVQINQFKLNSPPGFRYFVPRGSDCQMMNVWDC